MTRPSAVIATAVLLVWSGATISTGQGGTSIAVKFVEWDHTLTAHGLSAVYYDEAAQKALLVSDARHRSATNTRAVKRLFELSGDLKKGALQLIPMTGLPPTAEIEALAPRPDGGWWIGVEDGFDTRIYRCSKTFECTEPPIFKRTREEKNHGIEGLTVASDRSLLAAAMEGDKQGNTTIFVWKISGDTLDGPREYRYRLDRPPRGSSGRMGISEILFMNGTHLLVLERGHFGDACGTAVRLYQVQLDDRGLNTRLELDKHPMLDLAEHRNDFETPLLKVRLDNVEGLAWYPNGQKREKLLLVTDDNFKKDQVSAIAAVDWRQVSSTPDTWKVNDSTEADCPVP